MVTAPPATGFTGLHPVGTVRASDGGWFERTLAAGIAGGASNLEIDLRDGAPDVAVTGNRADGPASNNGTGTGADAGAEAEPRALTPPAPEPVAWRSST